MFYLFVHGLEGNDATFKSSEVAEGQDLLGLVGEDNYELFNYDNIHNYYLNAANLRERIMELAQANGTLCIVGHSFGGILIAIALQQMVNMPPNIRRIVLFDSPLTGVNTEYFDAHGAQAVRVLCDLLIGLASEIAQRPTLVVIAIVAIVVVVIVLVVSEGARQALRARISKLQGLGRDMLEFLDSLVAKHRDGLRLVLVDNQDASAGYRNALSTFAAAGELILVNVEQPTIPWLRLCSIPGALGFYRPFADTKYMFCWEQHMNMFKKEVDIAFCLCLLRHGKAGLRRDLAVRLDCDDFDVSPH
eukprot:m.25692 g.25692  ORF g.25692 m.25692 type:complete len:304 (+) comp11620_c1_seq1:574-1485(+)